MKKIVSLAIILFIVISSNAQKRPFIWVSANERPAILHKIETQAWAASIFKQFEARLEPDVQLHQNNAETFLMGIPFNWEAQKANSTPPLFTIDYEKKKQINHADDYMHYLQVGVDCGVMYYLTQDEKYAQCALDILHAFVQGILQLPLPSKENTAGGWIYPNEHLREAREVGNHLPIIYDFIATFIKNDGKPFDIGIKTKLKLSIEDAQQVFKNYAELAVSQGMTGSNWSVLEAPSMLYNLLALENLEDREKLLNIYLHQGSERQDPFTEIASHFQKIGDVYPETSQYSSGVAYYSTVLMTILCKYDPTLKLANQYPYLPLALSRWDAIKYPNDEIVRFGDGHRKGGTNFKSCEVAYSLGLLTNEPLIYETIGYQINTAISNGEYTRGNLQKRSYHASNYFEPLSLLWFADSIQGDVVESIPPRSENMPHASVFLQRNLSTTNNPTDALMCFVGGAHMVHGHAEGMNIELYGKGQVLGVDNGRGSYRTNIHENYSRLFAAHNTVIVNGNSCGEGGWVNLGINSVQLLQMEPMPREKAISPNHSFSTTSFIDDKGEKAEAQQERTLALIRTSPTTGYYVDVFRSKSALSNEYHDYIYHNIGDELTINNTDLLLFKTPERYMENANTPWIQNRRYRNPGWHFFTDVETSKEYAKDVQMQFVAEKFKSPIFMNLYIPGFEKREYSKVKAPKTFEAPKPYENNPTPTLVIRKMGEAWDQPFVVVYEPFSKNQDNHSIENIEKLTMNGKYCGVKIKSQVANKTILQYIITQTNNQRYQHPNLDFSFTGNFAIVTTNINNEVMEIYIGDGQALNFNDIQIKSKLNHSNAYIDLTQDQPKLKTRANENTTWKIIP